ncbi:hypothetical protein CLPU_1c01210 [Gottschalkia purinilytica]|uniref:DUF3221 domain-containing protein n=1 Tax=Gottschalkia purinilytica TaxID=1503 RepID=A0A0L0WEV3_GOTPU|nr:DUF3221 domain-containing protein [Gottschalkia purinilytica]KNF09956.1 hypothetical protein CLPU_1c01210 [Gottschalkia purinilytica]
MKRLLWIIIVFSLLITVGYQRKENTNNNTVNSKQIAKIVKGKSNYKVGIRGVVKSITLEKDGINLLLEGNLEKDTLYDKASVYVDVDTMIQKDDLKRLFKYSDINTGDTVEVIFEGSVAESYPVKGKAKKVKIISENNKSSKENNI